MDDIAPIEEEILKFLRENTGAAYNTLHSWALVARGYSNNGDGGVYHGGLFMPPGVDSFEAAGLRWLFDEGLAQRYNRDD